MGIKGRDNVRKRKARRKKAERLALAKRIAGPGLEPRRKRQGSGTGRETECASVVEEQAVFLALIPDLRQMHYG